MAKDKTKWYYLILNKRCRLRRSKLLRSTEISDCPVQGAVLYRADAGWEPLSFDEFARICYTVHGASIRQTQIKDLQHLFLPVLMI
jgi:hypothetical protein